MTSSTHTLAVEYFWTIAQTTWSAGDATLTVLDTVEAGVTCP